MESIARRKAERAQQVAQETADKYCGAKPFKLETAARPSNAQAVRDAVEQQIVASMQPAPAPKPVKRVEHCPVRMTTAAILREDALFQREQQKCADALRAFEKGLHDSEDFDEWQKEGLLADEVAKVRAIQRRKLEMQQSAVNAKEAVEARCVDKYISAQKMNVAALEIAAAKREADRLSAQRKHEMAAKVKEGHAN